MKRTESQTDILHSFSKTQIFTIVALELLTVVLSVLYPVLLSTSSLHRIVLTREYKAGELSDEDVISNKKFSYIDEYETQQRQDVAASLVLPFYSYSIMQSIKSDSYATEFVDAFTKLDTNKIEAFFKAIDAEDVMQSYIDAYSAIDSTNRKRILLILRDCVKYFSNRGIFSELELNNASSQGYKTIQYEVPINEYSEELQVKDAAISTLLTFNNIYNNYITWLSSYMEAEQFENINLIYNSLNLILQQNVFYNEQYTTKLQNVARDNVVPIRITLNQGDYILKTDEIITQSNLRTIDKINSRGLDVSYSELIAYLIFALIIVVVVTFVIIVTETTYYRTPLHLITLFAFLDVIIVAQYFLIRYLALNNNNNFAPFLPCFIIPLFYSYITNKQYHGFIAAAGYIYLLVLVPTSTVMWIFYYLIMIGCALYFLKLGTNRIDVLYQAFYTALSCAVVTIIFHFASGLEFASLATSVIGVVFNVVLSYILVSIILPLYEHWFNIPTKFKLHELSYTDTPVLNRLNQVALGTFNHSKNVAEMAYEGSKSINANAELARVGALYHDIGKSEHPEYFIENQQGGHNLHDDLNYTLSAAIIKSHVRLGIEKAKEAELPQEVIDIIAQHHGDDVIQYFYNEALKAVKENNVDATVSEEDFRYTGERPNSVEAAIVMLADCVEAASRTLKKPTSQRYDKLITNIFVSKINRNQLENSPLTLENLNTIKQAFIHVLLGRDHQRIKYDDEGDKD